MDRKSGSDRLVHLNDRIACPLTQAGDRTKRTVRVVTTLYGSQDKRELIIRLRLLQMERQRRIAVPEKFFRIEFNPTCFSSKAGGLAVYDFRIFSVAVIERADHPVVVSPQVLHREPEWCKDMV